MRARLHDGRRVYGSMMIGDSPRWPLVVKGTGLDWVFLDSEHGALDRDFLARTCAAYSSLGIVPVVRIAAPDPYMAAMVLDGGARGVIAPYVERPEQVRDLVGSAKLRPLKGRRLRERLAGGKLEPELESYLADRNADNIAIVNIESVAAMEALEEIVSVEGLDAVLIGPHDLSCNLGIPEQYFDPRYVEAVERIIRTAREHGIGAGIHLAYPGYEEQELVWAKMGANLITHSVDVVAFRNTMKTEIDTLKSALGD
jgi:4-hydroxy-2-oxoheptanedioate aldolase